ncbi:MAG: rhamnulokinase [Candidatus Sumerlaeota bacterium]
MPAYLAVDLGASSGRVVRGVLEDRKLTIEEKGRFENGMIPVQGRLYWDILHLFGSIRNALAACPDDEPKPESVGVDSWGVDVVLLAADGSMAGQAVGYRDSRTDNIMDIFFEKIPAKEIYERTGIQFLQFNTLYQFFAMLRNSCPQMQIARKAMMIPDFFHYLLSGKITTEFTNATTTQMLNVETKDWDPELLEAVGVPEGLLPPPVPPGTVIGTLTEEMQQSTGLDAIPVIAPATHDTGSAVAAVPANDENYAYISSGTWSLMGIETKEAITTEAAGKYNFTNEGGVEGTYRFLKNIGGLWLVQRCKSDFDEDYSFSELVELSENAEPFAHLVDPDDASFINPDSVPGAIAEYCRQSGQDAPATPGAFIRCSLESLALKYKQTLEELREVHSRPIERIHIVGGGTQNKLLCQMTADATGLPVVAGPVEATAIGNILMQAIALGHIASLQEGRKIIRNSFPVEEYEPAETGKWNEAWSRFQGFLK